MRAPSSLTVPAVGLDQLKDGPRRPSTCRSRSRRRGRASRLRGSWKLDAVDRMDLRRRRPEDALRIGKALGQARRPRGAGAGPAAGLRPRHDALTRSVEAGGEVLRPSWPRAAARSRRQRSVAKAQRGAKAQPAMSSRSERHAARDLGEPRRPRAAERRAEPRHRGEEARGVGMARAAEEGGDRRLLDLAAGVHHHDALGHLGHHAEVVGDEDDRGAGLALELAHELEDLGLDGDVERGRRLVGDEQLGMAGERHGDHHALAHAARELVRILPRAAARARGCRTRRSISIACVPRRPALRPWCSDERLARSGARS